MAVTASLSVVFGWYGKTITQEGWAEIHKKEEPKDSLPGHASAEKPRVGVKDSKRVFIINNEIEGDLGIENSEDVVAGGNTIIKPKSQNSQKS